jgi:hypothetical protein
MYHEQRLQKIPYVMTHVPCHELSTPDPTALHVRITLHGRQNHGVQQQNTIQNKQKKANFL